MLCVDCTRCSSGERELLAWVIHSRLISLKNLPTPADCDYRPTWAAADRLARPETLCTRTERRESSVSARAELGDEQPCSARTVGVRAVNRAHAIHSEESQLPALELLRDGHHVLRVRRDALQGHTVGGVSTLAWLNPSLRRSWSSNAAFSNTVR